MNISTIQRWQVPYEFFMAVLAFINLYFYYFEFTGVITGKEAQVAFVIDYMTIGIFALDYIVRLLRSRDKKHFVSHNVLDLVALIPLNPLFRMARLVRCIILFARFFKRFRQFSSYNVFLYVAFGTMLILFTSALLIAPIENMTFFEAVWWGVVTIATVGYGDFVPVSTTGRVIAMVLIFCGVGFLSFLTGTITTHYVNARLEKAGVTAHRGILRHYQDQLFHFQDMKEEDIEDMYHVLLNLKQEEKRMLEKKKDDTDEMLYDEET